MKDQHNLSPVAATRSGRSHSGPTFRYPLLFLSLISLGWGMWEYLNPPMPQEELFGGKHRVVTISGEATVYVRPRGVPGIYLAYSGNRYFFDCLINEAFCEGSPSNGAFVSAEVIRLGGDFYWPLRAKFSTGKVIDVQESKLLYEIYRDRNSGFYRFWLALGAALAGFSVWFGNRPLFENNHGENR